MTLRRRVNRPSKAPIEKADDAVDVLIAAVLYAIAGLGSGVLMWQVSRDKAVTGNKNLGRRAMLACICAICWPSAAALGLLYTLSPGRKTINWIVSGRTSLHDTQ